MSVNWKIGDLDPQYLDIVIEGRLDRVAQFTSLLADRLDIDLAHRCFQPVDGHRGEPAFVVAVIGEDVGDPLRRHPVEHSIDDVYFLIVDRVGIDPFLRVHGADIGAVGLCPVYQRHFEMQPPPGDITKFAKPADHRQLVFVRL
jgi:hypothetical protein